MAPGSPFKQKDKKSSDDAIDKEFTDLFPPITFRHLHASPANLGPKSPLRVISLVDSDAFYAACEQVRLNADPTLPLVVLQWDALIAVNYPARKFGITRMCRIKEALKMCPELRAVHVAVFRDGDAEPKYYDWEKGEVDSQRDKVSLDYYRRESLKIVNIFKELLPSAEIEKASIDEAFVDLTLPVRDLILERYPHLKDVPKGGLGLDTLLPEPPEVEWEGLGWIVGMDEEKNEAIDAKVKLEESDALTTPPPKKYKSTWHDVALSIGAELVMRVRNAVKSRLGYTMSAGIARNKFLAKLCASYKKPDSQSILRNALIPTYLRPIPFQKIRFLGGKLGKSLAEEYTVETVGDLLSVSLEEMQRKFGEGSIWVYDILRGTDPTPLSTRPFLARSMAASKNLLNPVTKPEEGPKWIRVLAAELAWRLREARCERVREQEGEGEREKGGSGASGVWPKTIVLGVRNHYNAHRSKQAPFPFTRHLDTDCVARAGERLWKEMVGSGWEDGSHGGAKGKGTMKITNMSLTFTGVEAVEAGQRGIEGFFGGGGGGGMGASGGASVNTGAPSRVKQEFKEKIKDEPLENVSVKVEHEGDVGVGDVKKSADLNVSASGNGNGIVTNTNTKAKRKRKRNDSETETFFCSVDSSSSDGVWDVDVDEEEDEIKPEEAEEKGVKFEDEEDEDDMYIPADFGVGPWDVMSAGAGAGANGNAVASSSRSASISRSTRGTSASASASTSASSSKPQSRSNSKANSKANSHSSSTSKSKSKSQLETTQKSPMKSAKYSFKCERCGEIIALPLEMTSELSSSLPTSMTQKLKIESEEETLQNALNTLRMEHEDYHFALDLANTDAGPGPPKKKFKASDIVVGAGSGKAKTNAKMKTNGSGSSSNSSSTGGLKSRGRLKDSDVSAKGKEKEGIERFFVRR